MKQYKESKKSFISNSIDNFYINNQYHGFYYGIGYYSGEYKGYFNLDVEYSHWIVHKSYNYYL